MKPIKVISVLLCLATSAMAQAEHELPPAIATQAQDRIDKGYHLGTIIGVVDQYGPRYYGFGSMSVTNSKTPDQQSIFEIGSIAKVFTASLLAEMDQSGDIQISAPLETILPDFAETAQHAGRSITLENLATHTAGLPRNPTNTDDNDDDRYKNYTAADLTDFLASYRITHEMSGFYYSNAGTLVLEHAIETKANTTYEELLQTRVLAPLGMTNTYFHVPAEKQTHVVTGFREGKETTAVDVGNFPAMGGILTTAEDMLTFLGAHLGLDQAPSFPAAKKTHFVRFKNQNHAMGLAWSIQTSEHSGKTIHYHKGGTNGFVSFAGINLEDQIGVVVLVNGRNWFSDMGFKILDPSLPLKEDIPPLAQ